MTGLWLGAALGIVGALLALTGVCGPWWISYLTSRRRMRRQVTAVLRDADCRRRAASPGVFAVPPPPEDGGPR